MNSYPAYFKAKDDGILDEVILELDTMLSSCELCPRKCKANRKVGEPGYCRAPYDMYISATFPHMGEEPELVGENGSGTIFLSHCNLRCAFCQNYDTSILGEGLVCTYDMMAHIMMELQKRACHNINFVTPTHYVPQILRSLSKAIERGFNTPLVYNCGGYESLEVIRQLDGIFDIYMPDIKFFNSGLSEKYCKAKDYPTVVRAVVKEMHRQVGDLVVDEKGFARRGLLVRHLVMPGATDDTRDILRFIAEDISPDTYVNIMAQYHPCHKAGDFPEISRQITQADYDDALACAASMGLTRASHH